MMHETTSTAPIQRKPKHITFNLATPEQIEQAKAGLLQLWRLEDGDGNIQGYCTRTEVYA